MRENNERHHPVRRHEQLGPRHGHDPPGARRGRDQLLRVQLRLRARRHVGDAVPRTPCGPRCSTVPPTRTPTSSRLVAAGRGVRGTLDDVPRPVQRRPRRAPSTTTATPRGVRPADAQDRREADPDRRGPPAAHPGVALQGVAEAMYSDVLWPALEQALAAASRATVRACWRSTTRTTSASPTARGATSWRRSRRSRAWTPPSA